MMKSNEVNIDKIKQTAFMSGLLVGIGVAALTVALGIFGWALYYNLPMLAANIGILLLLIIGLSSLLFGVWGYLKS